MIPLILIGAFLIGLSIDDIGDIGNVIMDIIGGGIILVAILIGRHKKEKNNHHKQTGSNA
ncbi:serine kinase [Neobacillus sp. NPDC097160]|uniref:serine kinase n=1 Tax=Neobacillus sp. NPDC097160 TaxID=3364298 RepID=UPI0038262409